MQIIKVKTNNLVTHFRIRIEDAATWTNAQDMIGGNNPAVFDRHAEMRQVEGHKQGEYTLATEYWPDNPEHAAALMALTALDFSAGRFAATALAQQRTQIYTRRITNDCTASAQAYGFGTGGDSFLPYGHNQSAFYMPWEDDDAFNESDCYTPDDEVESVNLIDFMYRGIQNAYQREFATMTEKASKLILQVGHLKDDEAEENWRNQAFAYQQWANGADFVKTLGGTA
jgi:hypothetical protein